MGGISVAAAIREAPGLLFCDLDQQVEKEAVQGSFVLCLSLVAVDRGISEARSGSLGWDCVFIEASWRPTCMTGAGQAEPSWCEAPAPT